MMLESIYDLLKSKLKGRVVNGTLINVITEDELDSIFKYLTDSQPFDNLVIGGNNDKTKELND